MLLTVNIGNTHTAIGLFDNASLGPVLHLRSDRERTTEEWATQLDAAFRAYRFPLWDNGTLPAEVALASVVPSLTPRLMEALTHLTGLAVTVISSTTQLGMEVRYFPPESLGADRFLGAFAAWKLHLQDSLYTHALVVDCGTATTFNVVSAEGEFRGGAILPGLGISWEALFAHTALPNDKWVAQVNGHQMPIHQSASLSGSAVPPSPPLIATNTQDALRSGYYHGFAAQVNGLISQFEQALGDNIRLLIVGTGGNWNSVHPYIPSAVVREPTLVLHGLRLAHAALRTKRYV